MSLASRWCLTCIRAVGCLTAIGLLAGCGAPSSSAPPASSLSGSSAATGTARAEPVALVATVRELGSGAPVPNGGWLTPGKEYVLDLVVRDADQQVHMVGVDPDAAYWSQRLDVRASGLAWRRDQRVLKPAGTPAEVPGGRYEVTVALQGAPALTRTLRFRPDWPLVRGLQPEDVVDLRFSVRTNFPDGALLPGEPGRLSVLLKDQRGREYSSDAPAVRALLASHLSIRSEAVAGDLSHFTLAMNPDWLNAERRQYTIELALGPAAAGLEAVRTVRTFVLPSLAYQGPEPGDVQTLDVPIGGLNPDDTLDPGKSIPFHVRVTDKNGRVFATGQRRPGELPLPWTRLTVRTENLRVNFAQERLEPEADLVKMAGKSYQLTVSYGARKALTATFVLKPFPYAWYRDHTLTAPQLAFGGEAGTAGQPGRAGAKGEEARSAPRAEAAPGHPGQPGGAGTPGRRGPDLTIAATLVRTFDNLVDLIFVEVSAQGKRSYFFRKPGDPPLKIVSAGGVGGAGGLGGEGGAGGGSTANGADGGPGGSGGPGSSGGDGGDIQLFLSRSDLQRHFVLESVPGAEGHGGAAGGGGAGGKAGTASALNGRQGPAGFSGSSGQPGRPGQVSVYTGGPAAELNNNPPPEFKPRLFLANFRVSAERKLISGPGDTGNRDAPPRR